MAPVSATWWRSTCCPLFTLLSVARNGPCTAPNTDASRQFLSALQCSSCACQPRTSCTAEALYIIVHVRFSPSYGRRQNSSASPSKLRRVRCWHPSMSLLSGDTVYKCSSRLKDVGLRAAHGLGPVPPGTGSHQRTVPQPCNAGPPLLRGDLPNRAAGNSRQHATAMYDLENNADLVWSSE